MRLLKFSHKVGINLFFTIFLVLQSCNTQTKRENVGLNLSQINEKQRTEIVERMQEQVNKKLPYQGSLLHQSRCDTLIALNHNVSGNYQEKSTPYTKIGDYHIAYPFLEKAYVLDPEGSLYYHSWVMLYYFRDYERAFELLTEFDAYTPDKVSYAWGENVNFLKGLALRQMKRYPEAINEFTKYIKDEGQNVDIYAFVYRGICHFYSDKHELAIRDFDYAMQKNENCSAAYFWKAELLVQKHEVNDANRLFEKALELVKKGHVKTDNYMEVFDMPNQMQIEDRIQMLMDAKK